MILKRFSFLKGVRFFNSLQWRLVAIFMFFTLVLVISLSASLNYFIESFYYDSFLKDIDRGFSNWDIVDRPTEEELVKQLRDEYVGILLFLVNKHKTYSIVEKRTNRVVYSTEQLFEVDRQKLEGEIQKSDNYLSAIAKGIGKSGGLVHIDDKVFVDYGRQMGDFVLYFRYYRDAWKGTIEDFNSIIQVTFIIAIIFSFIFGYLLSKTITVPIVKLMHNARRIAGGDFEQAMEVKSEDEIGKLTKAFNFMARDLKKTVNEMSREKNKIETILNYMADGVVAFTLNGEMIHANPASKIILGIDEFKYDFNEFSKRYHLGIEIEEISYLETYKTKEAIIDSGKNYIKVYFAIFTDEQKNPEGIIVVLRDITEQQKLEEMRREFVANVSHELRTPLTSIKSYSETLLDGALEDKETAERFLNVINTEADRMTRLVKDLLQLAGLDNKKIKWNMESMSFENMIRSCVEKVDISAKEKNQVIECFTIGEIPEVKADKDRMEQVILNILTNAIKYTPENGKITVYIGKMYSEVYVKISDTGIGIPQEDLERVFERFYRTDKARSREMGGTGLGLAIAKEIVDHHGGTISITSELHKGTEVTVKIPCENEEDEVL